MIVIKKYPLYLYRKSRTLFFEGDFYLSLFSIDN
jgi:hypothetical protein